MAAKATHQKPGRAHEIDKRDLVNLDLYHNEIRVMEKRLQLIGKQASKEVSRKIENIICTLKLQKEKLEKFRQEYEVEEMLTGHTFTLAVPGINASNTETFFNHLKTFEEEFKDIRQQVNEFIAEYKN